MVAQNNDFILYDDVFNDSYAIPARYSHYTDDVKAIAESFSKEVVNSLYRHSSEGKLILLNSGGLESTLLENILYHNNVEYTSYTLLPENAQDYKSTVFIAMQNYSVLNSNFKLLNAEDKKIADSATYCNTIAYSKSLEVVYNMVFWDLILQDIKENLPIVAGGFLRDIFNSIPQQSDNHKDFDNKFNNKLRGLFSNSEYNLHKVNGINSSYGKKVIFPYHNPTLIKKINELNTEVLQDNFHIQLIDELIKEDNIQLPLYYESPGRSLEVSHSIERVAEDSIKKRFNIKDLVEEEKVQRLWLDRYNSPKWG